MSKHYIFVDNGGLRVRLRTDLGSHCVNTAPVVGGEARLLRGDVARDLNLRGQLLVGEPANECFLRDEVPAMGRLHTPVDVSGGQGNAVCPGCHIRRRGAVPVADRLPI